MGQSVEKDAQTHPSREWECRKSWLDGRKWGGTDNESI